MKLQSYRLTLAAGLIGLASVPALADQGAGPNCPPTSNNPACNPPATATATVPEPGTLLLLSLGLVATAAATRRRYKK